MLKRFFGNEKSASDYTVLVVEDDDSGRQAILASLEEEGFNVRGAPNGAHALALLNEGPLPDALIVDLMMPEMDGQEFIKRGRVRFGRSSFPPSLLLSAAKLAEITANVIEVDDYLPKPFDLEDLLTHVWQLVESNASAANNV